MRKEKKTYKTKLWEKKGNKKKHNDRIFIGDDGSFNWFENGKLKKRLTNASAEFKTKIPFENEWYGIINASYSAKQISFENDWSNLEI